MWSVRRTAVAVAAACVVAVTGAGYAGADPLAATDDGASTENASTLDDSTSDDDSRSADEDGTSDDDTGTDSEQGIDLDHPVSDKELRQVTDYLVFQASMPDFQRVRQQRLLSDQVDWDTAACNNNPLRDSVDGFGQACERREFGYHNFQAQGRLDFAMRVRVDTRFKQEMRALCAGRDVVGRTACETQANLFFATVP